MPSRRAGPLRLTPREKDALAALRRGCTYQEGAAELGVGFCRFKNLVQGVYGFYGVTSRAELMARLAGDRPRREPGDWILYG